MDGSIQEGEVKKKITEVKTFPVPFGLGEKKEILLLILMLLLNLLKTK